MGLHTLKRLFYKLIYQNKIMKRRISLISFLIIILLISGCEIQQSPEENKYTHLALKLSAKEFNKVVSEEQKTEEHFKFINQYLKQEGYLWKVGKTKVPLSHPTGLIFPENYKPKKYIQSREEGLPDYFDWRDINGRNYISPVKDQGNCGSCWAFGLLASFEAISKIYYNSPDLEIDLSEQQLVSCETSAGCCGYVSEWIVQDTNSSLYQGVFNELELPYLACDASSGNNCEWEEGCSNIAIGCQNLNDNSSWKITENINNSNLKSDIINHGPVAVSIPTTNTFNNYISGIYNPSSSNADHLVLIVGFGITEAGTEYYIAKNSWGDEWGQEGYFQLSPYSIYSVVSILKFPLSPEELNLERECSDEDQDGYCFWGIDEQPTSCEQFNCTAEIQDCNDLNSEIYGGCGEGEFSFGYLEISASESAYGTKIYKKVLSSWEYIGEVYPMNDIEFTFPEGIIEIRFYDEYNNSGGIGIFEIVEGETIQLSESDINNLLNPIPVCGDTIYENSILMNHLLCSEGDGIYIGSNDISINCDNHMIYGINQNISITPSGIYLVNKDNITIKNCILGRFIKGIEANSGNNLKIIDNSFSDSQQGLSFNNYKDVVISNNNFLLNNLGMSLHLMNNTLISNNNFNHHNSIELDNQGGIDISFSENSTFINNSLCNNTGVDFKTSHSTNFGTGNLIGTIIVYESNNWPNFGEDYLYCNESWYCGDAYTQTCSSTQPHYCENGDWINNCQECGCRQGLFCQEDGSCKHSKFPIYISQEYL
jgi:C1A family cysteine protease